MNTADRPVSTARLWTSRIMSGLPVAFLLVDGVMKLFAPPVVTEASSALGFQGASLMQGIGIVLLVCTVLYVIPRTAVLGALLLTAYMGGTVVTHIRVGSPLFTHVLFGVYLAVMIWGGLYLREPRLRALLPLRAD